VEHDRGGATQPEESFWQGTAAHDLDDERGEPDRVERVVGQQAVPGVEQHGSQLGAREIQAAERPVSEGVRRAQQATGHPPVRHADLGQRDAQWKQRKHNEDGRAQRPPRCRGLPRRPVHDAEEGQRVEEKLRPADDQQPDQTAHYQSIQQAPPRSRHRPHGQQREARLR
jgi:hypothetical protein